MTRAARAVIDLTALKHNLQRAQTVAPGTRQFAIIKADAYGHGMLPVAQALQGADGFGVASLDEALVLRTAGITQPILLLEGCFHTDELAWVREHDLQIAVHHEAQLRALEVAARHVAEEELVGKSSPVTVWLKVDTGMHRLGFAPAEATAVWQRLQDCPLVADPPCLMSHFACADDIHDPTTQHQLHCFETVLPGIEIPRSIANSAGILGWPGSHNDIVRPGILLYGASPFVDETGTAQCLRPVMTLKSELIAVTRCRQGDAVGYGGTWICPEDMPIGVVAIGYGDGYPHHAPTGTPVRVNGRRVPLVGRVSMDMICVDLRTLPDARPGDPVVLWGEGLPAEEVARAAGTIAYELFCSVTARVSRDYVSPSATY